MKPVAKNKSVAGPADAGSLFRIPDLLLQIQPVLPQSPEIEPDLAPAAEPALSLPSPAAPENTSLSDPVDDIWLFTSDTDNQRTAAPEFKTWAAFERADIPNPTAVFGTEQGPLFVDALVAAEEDSRRTGEDDSKNESLGILDTHAYCACLLALALGRSSVLFVWDDSKKSFASLLPSARISGFTSQVLRSVEKDCLACGNNSRFLRAYVDHTYAASAASAVRIPSRVALARGIDGLLLTIQTELGARGQKAQSLLQLQALVQPVASLVQFVRGLVTKLARAFAGSPAAVHSDEHFLTLLFQEAQSMEYSVVFMRDIIKRLLQLVSAPWLGFVGAWIGLDPRSSKATLWTGEFQSKSFVRLDNRVWIDDMGTELAEPDYFLDEDKMPAFIPDEMRRDLFETGRNLRFLWTNHPEHPLSSMDTVSLARPPPLRWQFDWDAIHALDRAALAYERTLSQSFVKAASARAAGPSADGSSPRDVQDVLLTVKKQPQIDWRLPTIEFQFFGKTEDQIQQNLQTSLAQLAGPLPRPMAGDGDDSLAAILRRQLFSDVADDAAALDEFAPHWSLLPLLSFGPVVSAQARLVNRACMKLLFSVHGIRAHLQLQKEFQLLGNGMFCSRLSHALFDSDLAGADEHGTGGVQLSSSGLGLRLSSRNNETWPPASSELRLALMGILLESWSGGSQDADKVKELPGGMSFAVRDLSAEEMGKCMDPYSLEALDFLRLSYKPPSALMSVITPALLSKYDRIFRLLLSVLRMYYVVNQLFTETMQSKGGGSSKGKGVAGRHPRIGNVSTRFRIESRHFVANIMAYFLGTGVGMPWQKFEAWLDSVSKRLEADPCNASGRTEEASPEKLRERHEQVLDEMMLALLLRKRQQPLLVLLQSIFKLILDFAKGEGAAGAERRDEDNTAKMYASFRKKAAAFTAVCRGLSEKEADSVARKDYQHQQQYQDGSRAGEGSSLSKLLLLLDYNGSYSK